MSKGSVSEYLAEKGFNVVRKRHKSNTARTGYRIELGRGVDRQQAWKTASDLVAMVGKDWHWYQVSFSHLSLTWLGGRPIPVYRFTLWLRLPIEQPYLPGFQGD
jgi:hypothetical protein